LRFGVYLSPWDRNHAAYGTKAYVVHYRNQLRELLNNYGPLFEVWFDGANGGDGYYGGARETRYIDKATYYDWERTWQIVRDLQPDACIFSDAGPDVRWVGNERGIAGDPCWATLNRHDFVPGQAETSRLNAGDRPGSDWVPAECDVSIRPGWFYHPDQDNLVRSPTNLLDLYLCSVGRGASLLLNLPPDRRGLIHENDVRALRGFKHLLTRTFDVDLAQSALSAYGPSWIDDHRFGTYNAIDGDPQTYWYPGPGQMAELTLVFDQPVRFNIASLREYLPLGQRVEAFTLESRQSDGWHQFAQGTSIGNRRLLRTANDIRTDGVRLRITHSAAAPALAQLGLHCGPAARTAGKE
jgi:alpha-L-fucosidase